MTTDDDLATAAARPPEPDLGLFVVGFDLSSGGRVALRWAADLARRTSTAVRVVRCWGLQDVWAEAREGEPVGAVPSEAELAAVAQRRLEGYVHDVLGDGYEGVECVGVHSGRPVDVLVEQSAQAGLLFVGSHGRGPLGSAVLGSVSAQLVREAACPVVVVPHRVIAAS